MACLLTKHTQRENHLFSIWIGSWAERNFTPTILGTTEDRFQRRKLHTNGATPTVLALTLRAPNQKWSMLAVAVPDPLKQIDLVAAGWDLGLQACDGKGHHSRVAFAVGSVGDICRCPFSDV